MDTFVKIIRMKISKDKTIGQIQVEFSTLYPGLKLEFYSKKHKDHEGSPKDFQMDSQKVLESYGALIEGELDLNGEMTVSELEESFETLFGLNIQVFRRSAELWLQTTATDNWTLETQNRKGIHSMQSTKA